MGLFTQTFFIAILFLGVSSIWGTSEEDSNPAKIAKMYPKKYQPMGLKKYRLIPTDEPPTTTVTSVMETITENTETVSQNPEDELKLEDLTDSEESFLHAMDRTRKAATTTFCVEIRPSNPYQKPFQVCEPATPQYGYGYKQVKPPPRPVKYHQPQPSYGQQHIYMQQPVYPVQPSYGQPQQAQPQPQPQPQPQGGSGDGYERPVMVLPHVPVAEPYHVPKITYKPSNGGGDVYRSSDDAWADVAWDTTDLEGNMEGRSAYYNPYDSYGDDKTTIYDMHKKKELSYLPLITHSYSKTKPLKYLKVLKDLKKDKYKIDNDDYYRPAYYHPPPPPPYYEHEEGGYGTHKEESGSHGLVITCQPSAVGYTGQQNQMELSKHMNLLKNIYQQSEKLYNQQTLNSNPVSEMSGSGGGYVAPPTYRSSGGDWKEMKPGEGWEKVEERSKGWEKAEGRSKGWEKAEGRSKGWEKAEGRSKGWEKNEAEGNVRSSGTGWNKNEAESDMRKSGGDWQNLNSNLGSAHSHGGGKWNPSQAEGQLGLSMSPSAGPNPTVRMMSEHETTANFRNAQNAFALQQEMQRT